MTGRFGHAIDNFLIIMGAAAGGDAGFSAKPVPAEAEPASGTESKHCRQTAAAGV